MAATSDRLSLRSDLFGLSHAFYNRPRTSSTLAYLSPSKFEEVANPV